MPGCIYVELHRNRLTPYIFTLSYTYTVTNVEKTFIGEEEVITQWVKCKTILSFVGGGSNMFVLGAQNQNNHTKTVLIKTLLGPLALASYWLTLTY